MVILDAREDGRLMQRRAAEALRQRADVREREELFLARFMPFESDE
jgi:hypothetical protein